MQAYYLGTIIFSSFLVLLIIWQIVRNASREPAPLLWDWPQFPEIPASAPLHYLFDEQGILAQVISEPMEPMDKGDEPDKLEPGKEELTAIPELFRKAMIGDDDDNFFDVEVVHLFDADDKQTFDPMRAVKAYAKTDELGWVIMNLRDSTWISYTLH